MGISHTERYVKRGAVPQFLETFADELAPALINARLIQARKLDYRLTPLQAQIHSSEARFKVVACGRRAGKTYLGAIIAVETAMLGKTVWWIAPTYEIGMLGYRMVKTLASQVGVRETKSRRLLEVGNGEIQVKSADRPDNLRGIGLDLAILDEAALMAEETWYELVRPALIDKGGKALFLSTPKGLNWFYDVFRQGLSSNPEWISFNFPTASNTFLKNAAEEIAAARAVMPARLFRQEIMAEFIDDVGGVFTAVQGSSKLRPAPPVQGARYSAGVDLARLNDYTVVSVLRTDVQPAQQVWVERFNQQTWQAQVERVAQVLRTYRPEVVRVDQTGVGDAVLAFARRAWESAGSAVLGVTFTSESKAAMIQHLALLLEQGKLELLDDPTQRVELTSFAIERLSSGRLRYGAPRNKHDDTVIALALAAQSILLVADLWIDIW